MEISLGFYSHNEKNKVCRLKKALYELKQFPEHGLEDLLNQGDHTLFIKYSPDGKLTLLIVYVDDMIITGDDEIEKLTLKEKLATQFEMKELGKLKYFLKIEVAYSKQGKFGCKTLGIPIKQNHRIVCKESPTIEKLDIAYAIIVVSQFMHDPRERHLQAASPRKGLLFRKKGTLSMEIYTDVDYTGSFVDGRSIFRYCMFLGENLVTWRSKKQNVVVRSSVEAEFRVMAHGVCEGLLMKIILDDLKVKYERPINLFYNNNLAISIAHNPVQHNKTKHIEIDRHFIKEKLNSGFVVTTHVPIGLQVAYIFTKWLLATRFQEFNDKLGMIDIHLPT
ncbi:Copia protein, partial [Mucuna pruriens]